MSRQRLIALLVAALVTISAGWYLNTRRDVAPEVHGSPLLPSLARELDTVTSLRVLKGSATPAVTIHKQGEQWTVAERANYPADVPKLRKLLLALSDAKLGEEKTSDPANYSIIGVEDPTKPGATGAQIELTAKDGKLDVIIGKPVAQGNFARRPGEKSSYVVEPGISFEAEPRNWIDTRLLDISTDKIQSIQFKPQTGSAYTLRRVTETPKPDESKKTAAPAQVGAPAAQVAAKDKAAAPTQAAAPPPAAAPAAEAASKFVLEGVPIGRQAADSRTLAPSPTAFSNLTDDDVAPMGDIDFSKPSTVTLALSDGSVIIISGAAAGEKRWIQVSAPKDVSLSSKANGRAFEIASYRYDEIFKPLEQLLVPNLTPKPAAPAAKLPPRAKQPAAAPKP